MNFKIDRTICTSLPSFILIAALLCLFTTPKTTSAAEANYDTAWCFVYDGGIDTTTQKAYNEYFRDVKVLPNGNSIFVGFVSGSKGSSLLMKLDSSGQIVLKKVYNTNRTTNTYYNSQMAQSICIARNGDYLVGGARYWAPWIMRLDTLGNIKSTIWYYDSTKQVSGSLLMGPGIINCIRETSRGTILCAAGSEFGKPNPSDYSAGIEFDSTGVILKVGQRTEVQGYNFGGYHIEDFGSSRMISGNQAISLTDTGGNRIWWKSYESSVEEIGGVSNNISKAKLLRDGRIMVVGQACEPDCWRRYRRYTYDAWWATISYPTGMATTWNTTGNSGQDEMIYDFTQLKSGNLAFVGRNGDSGNRGILVFVTDSTGKNILWEKLLKIPYKGDDGSFATPFAVCATADSGFTFAGEYGTTAERGGQNALAVHIKPIPAVNAQRKYINSKQSLKARVTLQGDFLSFTFSPTSNEAAQVSVYNAVGRKVVSQSVKDSKGIIACGIDGLTRGIYFYRVEFGQKIFSGNFTL